MAYETLISISVGIGLAAACGFRVFVPLFMVSAAALGGYVPLAPGYEWIGTAPAIIAFATATLLEIIAYKVPWLDHALDTLATPAAVAAGIIISASVVADLPPLLRWGVILIGGGGAAGSVQAATVLLRLKSGLSTGGIANPLVSAGELAGAVTTSLVALMLPLVGLAIAAAACLFALFWLFRKAGGRRHQRSGGGPG